MMQHSVDNMQVLIFDEFGLKVIIHVLNGGIWGFYPLNGKQSPAPVIPLGTGGFPPLDPASARSWGAL